MAALMMEGRVLIFAIWIATTKGDAAALAGALSAVDTTKRKGEGKLQLVVRLSPPLRRVQIQLTERRVGGNEKTDDKDSSNV